MTKLLVNESGNLNPNCQKSWFLKRSGMKRLMASINHHTSFLDSKASLSERRFCLDNNFSGYPICISCGAEVRKFHGNSIKKYNKCCSQSCANRIGNSKKPKELYDSNSKKRVATLRSSGFYSTLKIKNAWTAKAREKRAATNMAKYGLTNAGVLGAYSSKSAHKYILNYLSINGIDENRCYFKWGGVNGSEFFQSSSINGKRVFFSYDLVVFRDVLSAQEKNMHEIVLVLEYNGPWHYTHEQAAADPQGKANPYPNSKTKIQTYEYDMMKFNHIKNLTSNFFVYWEKTATLEALK